MIVVAIATGHVLVIIAGILMGRSKKVKCIS